MTSDPRRSMADGSPPGFLPDGAPRFADADLSIGEASGSPFIAADGSHRTRSDGRAPRRTSTPHVPFEGWLGLLLLVVMGLTFGYSLDDARWVLGRDGLTDFLPWAVALGIFWGFISAKTGWGRWRSQLFGAVFAALLIPLFVGASLVDHVSLRDWYVAAAHSSVEAYLDLAWRGRQLTQQYGHFALVLGMLCWATGQFAGYTAFAHHKPMNSVMFLGVALVTNMSITIRDQLLYLVLFTVAALFFLIRLHAAEERSSWLRRRIGDPRTISNLYLRGGSGFVTAAVIGSLFLTASASSAPLAGAWAGIDQSLIGIGQLLQRYFPAGGPGTRITGISFGTSSAITGRWVTDSTPAISITLPPEDDRVYYWRAISYDSFDLNGWSVSTTSAADRAGGTAILADTTEGTLGTPVTREITFSVTPLAYRGTTVFSPYAPGTVSRATRVSLLAGDFFNTLDLTAAGGYEVRAAVPATALDTPEGITENKLRAAGQSYTDDVKRWYLEVPAGAVGPNLRALRDQIAALVPGDNPTPYDIARTTTAFLRSDAFTYSTDVTNIDCGDASVVECFALYRRGYCQHYASTMAILLRLQGIPTRLVQGFLPGERDANGSELIRYSNSHAWVEVFFPGYGWVSFDPTGGGVAQLEPLPLGPPVATARPSVSPSFGLGFEEEEDPLPPRLPESTLGGGSTDILSRTPFFTIAALLIVVAGAAAFVAWRRTRRRVVHPDAVYGGLTRWASLFGFRPRATETVYEYTGALASVVPHVRPDLQVVANAKVDVAYGRRQLGEERIRALREAQRRVRLGLLRLVARRRGRGR